MFEYKVKVGLVPMRRNVSRRPEHTPFNWVSAQERGRRFIAYIEEHFGNENVEFADTKGLGGEGMVFDTESAAAAAAHFEKEKVDAVLLINANFGDEEVAADLARELGKPFCIWAPLDEEYCEDGVRTTDSQCGLFGISRQLQRFDIPFSHIPGCRVESEAFRKGFVRFTRVACMVKNVARLRIGQIGSRPMPFFSVIWNEAELMRKFGLKIIPVNFAIVQERYNRIRKEGKEKLSEYIRLFTERYQADGQTERHLEDMACLLATYRELFEEFRLDALSAECWTATPVMFDGLAPCAVNGMLNDMGYLVSCESDVHAVLTMSLLAAASFGKARPFMGEFTARHPENENAELLWHCGPFPLSVKAEDSVARLVNQRESFRVKEGEYTLARIDQENGNYMMLAGKCRTTTGPLTNGTYLWAQFENLQAWEDRLLDGPYIHHFVEIEGDYTEELREFCKYFPELKMDNSVMR